MSKAGPSRIGGLIQKLRPDPYMLALVGMVGLASLLPARGQVADGLGLVTKLAVGLLFFLHGARLSSQSVMAGLVHWRLHLTISAISFGLFPLIGLGVKDLLAFTRMTGDLVKAMIGCGKPVIAAVDGVAVGAGAIISMASDLRLATPATKCAFLFTRVGLAGCDMGACALLPRPCRRSAVAGDAIAMAFPSPALVRKSHPPNLISCCCRWWASMRMAIASAWAVAITIDCCKNSNRCQDALVTSVSRTTASKCLGSSRHTGIKRWMTSSLSRIYSKTVSDICCFQVFRLLALAYKKRMLPRSSREWLP